MYRVLYRKWRPKIFRDVIGQPQVTQTLASQIKDDRLAHAYLFTGSRGTGKTTCAKIFSKAVNCLHPVNGDPCNEWEICRGIDNGSVLDIVEIDAASNRGIDDIRLLRDEVNFTPSQAKYRVYIIDEVHMLTIEAFNALLKTLEEPPAHVKFILATTEVHKLPSTILSRCQRFDFRRIEPSAIAERLVEIASAENASLDHDAAVLIARIADGGMRDALSLLDRALSVSENVTVETVSASAGLMNREYLDFLLEAVAGKDTARCLSLLDELHRASCDTERLCTELIERFRSFLIIKTVKEPGNLLVCTDDELERIKALSERFTQEQVLYSLNVLAAASEAIRKTQNRRIEAEMALIKLCRPEAETGTEALLARISALEKEIAELRLNGITVKNSVQPPAASKPASVSKPAPVSKPAVEKPFAEKEEQKPFSGFAADSGASMDYADAFADLDEEEKDGGGEEFDFEQFMRENSSQTSSADGADDGFAPDGFADEEEPQTYEPFPEEPDSDLPFADGGSAGAPAQPDGTPIEPRTWKRVILGAEKSFPMLTGMLTDSVAWISGGTVTVRLRDKNLNKFVPEAKLLEEINKSAKEQLHADYKIKLDKGV